MRLCQASLNIYMSVKVSQSRKQRSLCSYFVMELIWLHQFFSTFSSPPPSRASIKTHFRLFFPKLYTTDTLYVFVLRVYLCFIHKGVRHFSSSMNCSHLTYFLRLDQCSMTRNFTSGITVKTPNFLQKILLLLNFDQDEGALPYRHIIDVTRLSCHGKLSYRLHWLKEHRFAFHLNHIMAVCYALMGNFLASISNKIFVLWCSG